MISGAIALVTGATGGLGGEIARALHARGASLLLSGRDLSALELLCDELPGSTPVVCDLADRSQLDALAVTASTADIVVANAALPGVGALDDFDGDEIDAVLDVNLRAPIHLARSVVPAMRARGRGHLVFVASISAKLATPRLAVYTATKFGLRGFALGLRQDLHGSGVSASLVHPGPVSDAGMWVNAGVEPPRSAGPRTAAAVGRAVVQAVEKDRAEVHVSNAASRFGVLLAELAPDRFAALLRRSGSADTAEAMAAGLRRRSEGP